MPSLTSTTVAEIQIVSPTGTLNYKINKVITDHKEYFKIIILNDPNGQLSVGTAETFDKALDEVCNNLMHKEIDL